jgi:hypothetical protein
MHRLFAGSIALALPLAFAAPAGGLTFLADDRVFRVSVDGVLTTLEPESFLAPFSAAGPVLPAGGQDSSISVAADGLGFTALASGGATFYVTEWPGGSGNYISVASESIFSITFRMDQPGQLDLTGILIAVGADSQRASVRILAGADVLFEAAAGPSDEEELLDFSTALPPGTYTLEAVADVPGVDGGAAFGQPLSFEVREIPEPVGGILLGFGLAGLAFVRRRAAHRLAFD